MAKKVMCPRCQGVGWEWVCYNHHEPDKGICGDCNGDKWVEVDEDNKVKGAS